MEKIFFAIKDKSHAMESEILAIKSEILVK